MDRKRRKSGLSTELNKEQKIDTLPVSSWEEVRGSISFSPFFTDYPCSGFPGQQKRWNPCKGPNQTEEEIVWGCLHYEEESTIDGEEKEYIFYLIEVQADEESMLTWTSRSRLLQLRRGYIVYIEDAEGACHSYLPIRSRQHVHAGLSLWAASSLHTAPRVHADLSPFAASSFVCNATTSDISCGFQSAYANFILLGRLYRPPAVDLQLWTLRFIFVTGRVPATFWWRITIYCAYLGLSGSWITCLECR